MKALIVDDDDVDYLLLSKTFQKRGHETELAQSIQSAFVKLLSDSVYDVVVVDYYLPGVLDDESVQIISKYHDHVVSISGISRTEGVIEKSDLQKIVDRAEELIKNE